MSSKIKSFLKQFDMYGVKVDLNFQRKQINRTLFGSIISIIIIFCFLLGCYVYGKELIEKKKPIVVTNERFVRSPQRMDFDKKQQTLMMGVRRIDGISYHDPSIYNIAARLNVMKKTFNETTKEYKTSFELVDLKMKRCSIDDVKIEKLKPFFNSIELSDLVCFDDYQDIYIEGDISADSYRRIEIIINQCTNSTLPNSVVCAPQEKLDKLLGTAYFNAYIIDKLVDNNNLENPFSYEGVDIYAQISNKQQKEINAVFSNYYIQSDIGFINSDIEEKRDFLLVQQTETFSFLDPEIVAKLVIRPMKNRETVSFRRYLKISDIVAQLGGILKLVTVIGFIITNPFVKFHLNKEIVNSIFDFDFEGKLSDEQQQLKLVDQLESNQIQQVQTANKKSITSDNLNEFFETNNIRLFPQTTTTVSTPIKQNQPQIISSNKLRSFRQVNNNVKQEKSNQILNANQTAHSNQNQDSKNEPSAQKNENDQENQQDEIKQSVLKNENDQENQLDEIKQSVLIKPISNFQFVDDQRQKNKLNSNEQSSSKDFELKNQQSSPLQQSIVEWSKIITTQVKRSAIYKLKDYFYHIIFPFPKDIKQKKQIIDESIKKVQSHLDIQYILNKFQELDKLKQILLTEDQTKLFELLPRPVVQRDPISQKIIINNKYYNENKSYDEKYKQAYNSLQNIFNKEKISHRDFKVIELLDNRLLNLIKSYRDPAKEAINYQLKMQDFKKKLVTIQSDKNLEQQNIRENLSIQKNNFSSTNSINQIKESNLRSQNIISFRDNNQLHLDNDSSDVEEEGSIQTSDRKFNFFLKYNKNSYNI